MTNFSTKLSIVIVSYNTADLTVQTVKSVFSTWDNGRQTISRVLDGVTEEIALALEVIVVDNDSHDETVARLKKIKDRRLQVVESGENLGFGRGNNLGIAKSRGDYILFLNSDTLVQPEALQNLLETYLNLESCGEAVGLLAASLQNPDQTYQAQGGDLPGFLALMSQWWFWDDIPVLGKLLPSTQKTGKNASDLSISSTKSEQKNRVRTSTFCTQNQVFWQGWVGGTAVLVSRVLIDEFGAWDEKIFMYGEDVEWSWRLAKAGRKNALTPVAQIIHFGQASSSSKNAILGEIKGLLYVWEKYRGRAGLSLVKLIVGWGCILRILFYSIKHKQEAKRIYEAALALVRQ